MVQTKPRLPSGWRVAFVELGRNLHRARTIAFYTLTAVLTFFTTFEFFAHLPVNTPVATQWTAGSHHIHALAHATLNALLVPAMATQLYPRVRKIAGMQQFLVVAFFGLAVSLVAKRGFANLDFPVFNFTLYSVMGLIIATLHPSRGDLLRFRQPSARAGGIALLAIVPLAAYGATEAGKQMSGFDPAHALVGHWALMAGLASSLIGVIGLTALRTEGWRLPLWSAGLAMVALGIGSVAMHSEPSSFGLMGGTAAVLWGAASIAILEIAYRRANKLSIATAGRPN